MVTALLDIWMDLFQESLYVDGRHNLPNVYRIFLDTKSVFGKKLFNRVFWSLLINPFS